MRGVKKYVYKRTFRQQETRYVGGSVSAQEERHARGRDKGAQRDKAPRSRLRVHHLRCERQRRNDYRRRGERGHRRFRYDGGSAYDCCQYD